MVGDPFRAVVQRYSFFGILIAISGESANQEQSSPNQLISTLSELQFFTATN